MKKIITLIMVAVLMISFAVMVNAATGTVVYATKVDKAPNYEEDTPFIDKSWGEPAIVINSSSPNTQLYQWWQEANPMKDPSDWNAAKDQLSTIQPEDNDVALYYLWDNKYLYFAMKTLDSNPSGGEPYWWGDGAQMWISPFEVLGTQNYAQFSCAPGEGGDLNALWDSTKTLYDYTATLDTSDWDSNGGLASLACEFDSWVDDDGHLYVYFRIPLSNIGLNPKSNLHGTELATAVMRVSSVEALDQGCAGWLAWGKYFYQTTVDGFNTLVLVDPAQGGVNVDTTPVETEAPETTAPETEAPETTAPETEAPETQAPETEAPETQAPETEAPAVETEAPETDAPETEAPVVETEAPETEAPAVETEAPETDAPAVETEAPETDAPVVETEAPETDAPVAPETNAPETQAPAAPAEPAKKGNTGLIIGIVAAVVVVGAIVGIVLGKKKKQ